MKKKSMLVMAAAAAALTLCSLQPATAQGWVIGGNTVTKDTTLGTKNGFALKTITNNVERMRISALGDVGIGTVPLNSTPYRLEVARKDGNHRIARFINASTTGDLSAIVDMQNGNGVQWRFGVGGTGNNRGLTNGQFYIEKYSGTPYLTITNNGLVGIRTTAPSSTLDILGGNWDIGNTEGDLRIGNPTYRLKIGVATGGLGAGDVYIRSVGGTRRIILGGGTSNVLTIDGSSQNVGIGTTTPGFPLNFSDDLGDKISLWGDNGDHYGFGVQGNLLQI